MGNFGKVLSSTCLAILLAAPASASSLQIDIQPIEVFDPEMPDQTRFGRLEFLSGAVLTSDHEYFGGLSGIRFTEDTATFYAITDKARFIEGRIARKNGRISEITDATISRATNAAGKTITGADDKDAEALEIVGNQIVVAYERNDRVMMFNKRDETLFQDPDSKTIDLTVLGLPNNRGPEALALDTQTGNLIAIAEHALGPHGNHRVFILSDGEVVKEVPYKLRNGFSVTDAAFDKDGNLWVLERYYSVFTGVFMQLRLINRDTLESAQMWDGEVLMSAGPGQQIDNMEGLALTTMDDGSVRVTMVSDDNFSKRQRTLLLEFSYRP